MTNHGSHKFGALNLSQPVCENDVYQSLDFFFRILLACYSFFFAFACCMLCVAVAFVAVAAAAGVVADGVAVAVAVL